MWPKMDLKTEADLCPQSAVTLFRGSKADAVGVAPSVQVLRGRGVSEPQGWDCLGLREGYAGVDGSKHTQPSSCAFKMYRILLTSMKTLAR